MAKEDKMNKIIIRLDTESIQKLFQGIKIKQIFDDLVIIIYPPKGRKSKKK